MRLKARSRLLGCLVVPLFQAGSPAHRLCRLAGHASPRQHSQEKNTLQQMRRACRYNTWYPLAPRVKLEMCS